MIATVIQARVGSTRLPRKVLMDVAGQPMLAHVVARSDAIARSDLTVVATSTLPGDDAIAELAAQRGWRVFRGSEDDVLDRYVQAGREAGADHVIRVTSDCPAGGPGEADRVIAHHLDTGADYTQNITVWGGEAPAGRRRRGVHDRRARGLGARRATSPTTASTSTSSSTSTPSASGC